MLPVHGRARFASQWPLTFSGAAVQWFSTHVREFNVVHVHSIRETGLCICREQLMYRTSAIAASALFIGMAVAATYYRFFFHARGAFPLTEFWCSLLFIGGGMVRPPLHKLLRRLDGMHEQNSCMSRATKLRP